MDESAVHIAAVVAGPTSSQQAAALAWARERYAADEVPMGTVPEQPLGSYDLLWWHRDAPLEGGEVPAETAEAVRNYVRDGGGVLLSGRAMAAVPDLGIDAVGPDAVGIESITEPTGPLWKAVHDDHPAVEAFDDLRIPVADRGTAPTARYTSVLPQEGEVLAATVRDGQDALHDHCVVGWHPGEGTVIGVGAPLRFDDDHGPAVVERRDALVAGLVEAVASGPHPAFARPETGADIARLRAELAEDPHRPRCHVSVPANWLNDPNGLVRWDGRYHVFYQYNPAGPVHDTIHWGHATSEDLVTWEDEPVALSPSPEGPDRHGCWSGCAVDDDGTPTIVYTGAEGRTQLPCLARSGDPNLRTWQKHPDNPVIETPPADLDVLETEHWRAEFRDHCIWRENGQWYHLVGAGLSDVGGAALLYIGESLAEWTFEGVVLDGEGIDAGPVWECPELLELGERDLLHVSNYEDVLYFVGSLEGATFDVESRGKLDHGDFYAPQSLDDGDRYLTWGWLPEARDGSAQWDAGWSGTLSLPRVLDVAGTDVRQRPAPEVEQLRERRGVAGESRVMTDGDRWRLPTSGRRLELSLTLALDDAEAATLSVFESPDREEVTELRYDRESTLTVDRSRASDDPRATAEPQSMPATPADEPLSLRVFLDGSVVEVFANERHCLTSRVYPTRPESTGLSVAATGGRATVEDLSVWHLGPAWDPER